jgi:hypothetical protein
MANGRPGDDDSVGDDLEVIEFVTEEPIDRPEPDAGDEDRPPRRRGLVVLALAAVVVAIVGVGVAVLRDDGDARPGPTNPRTSNASRAAPDAAPTSATIPPDERPPPTTPGDASTTAPLLPEGAPSTPHTGELVASVADQTTGGGYALYADGRLIWSSGRADASGGMVEQRLTPEGVERVRAEVLAAGEFTANALPGNISECMSAICVRGDDGRLLGSVPGPVSPVTPASAAEARLVSYLSTLASSLPKTEWAAPRIKTYVPARFIVCIGTYANLPDRAIPVQIDLATVLSAFPTGAAELFASREAHGGSAPCLYSYETTLEEARTLADVFLSPTGGGTHEYSGIVIRNEELAAIQSDRSEGIIAYVSFQPLLPNGTLTGPVVR